MDRATALSARVSVIIPTRNRHDLVTEAIDSVLRQTAPPHEVIVVDDGSRDATLDVLERYGKSIVLLSQPHRGVAAARNCGLTHATGDWVAFLDSDDVWAPTKLHRQLRFLEDHADCDLVHTAFYSFGDRDGVRAPPVEFLSDVYAVDRLLFAENWICPSSVLMRGGAGVEFREWAAASEDIVFFADLLMAGRRFAFLNEVLVGRRYHGRSINRQAGAQTTGVACQWRWIAEAFAAQPREHERLARNLLAKVVGAMMAAKWRRDWDAYWQWRGWLTSTWSSEFGAPPKELTEVILPRFAYDAKDRYDALVKALSSETARHRDDDPSGARSAVIRLPESDEAS